MTETIKTAIVGAGRIAWQHIACLKTIPGVEVAAVCDLSPVRAEYVSEALGAGRAFSDFSAMLAEIEPQVVHVTTPPASREALMAGAHVFVEKPVCVVYSDYVALRALAAERGRFLVEDHNYLWNPEVRRTLDWMADGTLGRITGLEVFFAAPLPAPRQVARGATPVADLPGGQIFDFLPHMAYLANAFVGSHAEARTLWTRSGESVHVYDEFRALVDCRDGPATLAFSARSQPNSFGVTVHGSRARVRMNLLEPHLSIDRVRSGSPALAVALNGLAQARANFVAACAGLWGRIAANPGPYAGMWEILKRTYEALRRGEPQPVSVEDIDATQRLLAALVPQHEAPPSEAYVR